jgi:hypothetical protein
MTLANQIGLGVSLACGGYLLTQLGGWLINLLPTPKELQPLQLQRDMTKTIVYGVIDE